MFVCVFAHMTARLTLRRLYSSSKSSGFAHTTTNLLGVLVLTLVMTNLAECCSSRATPKPRPPAPTSRPNITFQTYACPEAYAKWYCLNGATCFSVRVVDSILYNCECATGFMGQRCEFKDLDGSYSPSRERIMIESAGIAGGVTLTVLIVVMAIFTVHHYRNCVLERLEPLLAYEEDVEYGATVFDNPDSWNYQNYNNGQPGSKTCVGMHNSSYGSTTRHCVACLTEHHTEMQSEHASATMETQQRLAWREENLKQCCTIHSPLIGKAQH